MQTRRLIAIGLAVGALVAITGLGERRFHLLLTFTFASGFVVGVGMLVNHATESVIKGPNKKTTLGQNDTIRRIKFRDGLRTCHQADFIGGHHATLATTAVNLR